MDNTQGSLAVGATEAADAHAQEIQRQRESDEHVTALLLAMVRRLRGVTNATPQTYEGGKPMVAVQSDGSSGIVMYRNIPDHPFLASFPNGVRPSIDATLRDELTRLFGEPVEQHQGLFSWTGVTVEKLTEAAR